MQALACNTAIVNQFWLRWKREYVVLLNKNASQTKGQKINKGDIMLLNEGPLKQHNRLVKVVELLPGRDSKVRSVKLLCNKKIITRPIRLLHHLEINNE